MLPSPTRERGSKAIPSSSRERPFRATMPMTSSTQPMVCTHPSSMAIHLSHQIPATPGLWLDKTAATKAKSAADDANKAANLANTAAASATAQAAEAQQQATAAEEKAQLATEAATRADEKIAEMNSLAGQIASGFIAPSRMNLRYQTEISIRNKQKQKIEASILPAYLPQSVLYQRVEGDSVMSDPSGNLTVKGTGKTKFWVIPTANTPLWQEVTINVRQPYMRLSATGKIRKNGNKIRIV